MGKRDMNDYSPFTVPKDIWLTIPPGEREWRLVYLKSVHLDVVTNDRIYGTPEHETFVLKWFFGIEWLCTEWPKSLSREEAQEYLREWSKNL